MALTKIELATSQLMTMVGQMQNLVNAIDVAAAALTGHSRIGCGDKADRASLEGLSPFSAVDVAASLMSSLYVSACEGPLSELSQIVGAHMLDGVAPAATVSDVCEQAVDSREMSRAFYAQEAASRRGVAGLTAAGRPNAPDIVSAFAENFVTVARQLEERGHPPMSRIDLVKLAHEVAAMPVLR